MRVLFLDFDGVVNSRRFFMATAGRQDGLNLEPFDMQQIDPVAVARIERVCAETGAVVVVSSAWRLATTAEALQALLAARGFTGRVIGCTPIHREDKGRYREIAEWLAEHEGEVESFAIVDDDHDAGITYASRFVRTSFSDGITDADADKLIAILNRRAEAA